MKNNKRNIKSIHCIYKSIITNFVLLLIILTGSFLSSCGGSATTTPGNIFPTLDSIQTNIFTPKCATSGCHSINYTQETLFTLAKGFAVGATRGVPAIEPIKNMSRILPGFPDESYLVLKIEGRAKDVGGIATRMPLNAPPLTNAEIEVIKDWIAMGAE